MISKKKMTIMPSGEVSIIPLANIISYYQFDNNVLDSIGSNNGTATDVTYASGQVGNVGVFNGTTSKVIIPSSTDLSFTNGVTDLPFSVSFLAKHDVLSRRMVCGKGGTTAQEYFIYYRDGYYWFYMQSSTTNNIERIYISSNDFLPINETHHIICTYDGSELDSGLNIFINGVISSVTRFTNAPYTGMVNRGGSTYIGTYPFDDGTSLFADGNLDEIAFFNKKLSQSEITEIYNLHNAGLPLI